MFYVNGIPQSFPKGARFRRILLNFVAVDWSFDLWINGIKIVSHKGAYIPFSFDITPFLTGNGDQQLKLRVWDLMNTGFHLRGKQMNDPRFFTGKDLTGMIG